MASTKKSASISTALETANTKKENLRKAFEALQSQSSFLSSFTLKWKDLEDHFDSIRKNIEGRLKELESKENNKPEPEPEPEPAKKNMECVNHPEMKTICAKMDGMGLRKYVMEHRKELTSIREEVSIALRSATDPARMVLDAMQGFYMANSRGEKDGEVAAMRRTCILLLEELGSVEISLQVKERAKRLAIEWKGKVSPGGENPLEYLALLQLIATYGLAPAFSGDELLDLAIVIARRKQAVDLIKALGLSDKVSDFVPKLTDSGKHLDAVKFVYAFELVDKFPPVPLLKAYQKQSKKVAQDIRNKGNHSVQSLNEAIAKELAALRAIIKIIEENSLESEFPTKDLDKRIEQLEKQKADKKRPATGPAAAAKQQQQLGNKRPRSAASNTVASVTPSISQSQLQPASSLVDRAIPYMSSSAQYALLGTAPSGPPYLTSAAGSYGLGANPTAGSYGLGANPTAGSYGLGANPLGYGVTRSPSRSYLYSFESNMESNAPGLYDRSMGFGGPGMPPSHRSPCYP